VKLHPAPELVLAVPPTVPPREAEPAPTRKVSATERVLSFLGEHQGEPLTYAAIAAGAGASPRNVRKIIPAVLRSGQISRIPMTDFGRGRVGFSYFRESGTRDAYSDRESGTRDGYWPDESGTRDEQWAPESGTRPHVCMPAIYSSLEPNYANDVLVQKEVIQQAEVRTTAETALERLEAEANVYIGEPGRSKLVIAFGENEAGVWACWQKARFGDNPVGLLLTMIACGDHLPEPDRCGRCGKSGIPLHDVAPRFAALGGPPSGWKPTEINWRWLSCEECQAHLNGVI